MSEGAASADLANPLEKALREQLAHGDAMLGSVTPVLRHLVANDDNSIFGDDVVARVRGMLADVSRQLLESLAVPKLAEGDAAGDLLDPLATALAGIPGFLGHVHALAIEWQLTERLQSRLAVDPVLPPLLQALIGSTEPGTASLAMKMLASQARFCQAQRRMMLPLSELPGDILHAALLAMRALAGAEPEVNERAANAEAAIRAAYDEGASRLGMISRLVTGMGGAAVAALSVTHAGVAIFLTALSLAACHDRDLAVLSTCEGQQARLVLTLRAAGLKPKSLEEQFLAIHPHIALPGGLAELGVDRAAAILAVSGGFVGA